MVSNLPSSSPPFPGISLCHAALIDAYRTNLKATHWQEVVNAVTVQCPNASPMGKIVVQCRHVDEHVGVAMEHDECRGLEKLTVDGVEDSCVVIRSHIVLFLANDERHRLDPLQLLLCVEELALDSLLLVLLLTLEATAIPLVDQVLFK